MKRSRIFLGITTALLAVAGVAAAKAHRLPAVTVYYGTLANTTSPFHIKTGHCHTVPAQYNGKFTLATGAIRGSYTPTASGSPIATYLLYTNTTCLNGAYYDLN